MTNKTYLGIALVVIIIAIGAYFFPTGNGETVVERIVGSSPTTEIVGSEEFTVNGITHVYKSRKFSSATTTPCSIPFPNGTSTPLYYSVSNGSGTSTAATFDVSTSSTAYATSTTYNWVHQRAVAGGAWDRFVAKATTSATNINADGTIKSDTVGSSQATTTWFVLKAGPGAGGYTIPGASCQAEFILLQR